MYGLPLDFPHGSLFGAKLVQVCIGENDLQLHFDDEISISTESSIRLGGITPRPSPKTGASFHAPGDAASHRQ